VQAVVEHWSNTPRHPRVEGSNAASSGTEGVFQPSLIPNGNTWMGQAPLHHPKN
jgi:hypothetical protein